MTRSLYVIGGPGTGKSTLVLEVLSRAGLALGDEVATFHSKPNVRNLVHLKGKRLHSGRPEGAEVGAYLGLLRGITSGSDALDKANPPVALEWFTEGELPDVVVSEGMRFCSVEILSALARRSELLVVHLKADPDELERRFEIRGSTQSEQFVRNGQTRSRRVAEGLRDAGVADVVDLDSTSWRFLPDDFDLAVGLCADWLILP